MTRTRFLSPKALLLGIAFLSVAVCALTVYGATHVRWLGLRLTADEHGEVSVLETQGPARAIPVGAREVALIGSGEALAVTAVDLLEEPDFLDSYADMNTFHARQAELQAVLTLPVLTVRFSDARGQLHAVVVKPTQRPLADLPAVFWFQLLAGASGCLIAAWVFATSARSIATRSFLLMGVTFMGFTAPAALYGTRELALDAGLFQLLCALNHLFAFAFGAGLMALFLCHPRQLLGARGVWAIGAVVVPWALLDLGQLLNPDFGYRIPILLEQLTAIGLAGAQWLATKGDPRARAELRWLATSVLVGAGLFVFCTAGMSLLGMTPPFAQGYAFGFFSLMYVGFALGLRRHQLLGLDEWAFRVLLWVLAAVLLIVLDLLMVLWLGEHSAMSLSAALLVSGFLYMPLRNWLWSRTLFRSDAVESALFEGVIESAFAGSAELREQRWLSLLERYFQPAEIHRTRHDGSAVEIIDDGVSMLLPATAGLPALRLAFPWRGRGLFAARHLTLATTLVTLMRKAESTREAFARGVLVERQRIARDLHDNLGARLLSGLYAETIQDTREGIRHAISDMRSIVQELMTDRSYPLGQLIADLRHETAERTRAASLLLDWPEPALEPELQLSPALVRNYTAVLRELVSNAIRHARASRLTVSTRTRGDVLETSLQDDGIGMQEAQSGNGLRSVRTRVRDLGGELSSESDARGTLWLVRLPLASDVTASELASQRAE